MGLAVPTFKHIGVKEGLGNGFIIDATIDRQGFVWVATEEGISRVAGNFITPFAKNNSAISGNETVCLYFYPLKNQIWIGTKQSGISIYDCNTGHFSHLTTKDGLLSMDIADISSAEKNCIWILHRNKGIQKYNPSTGTFEKLTMGTYGKLPFQARVCVDDGLGHLYVGNFGSGLTVLDLNKKRMKRYVHSESNHNTLPSNYVRAVHIDSQHHIWIGTNEGAAILNPINKEIQVIDQMAGKNIFDIAEMSDGKIWFATDLGGITILDRKGHHTSNLKEAVFTQLTAKNSTLSSSNVRKIMEDSFGNIWISNYCTGIDLIPAHANPFDIINFKQSNGFYQQVYGLASDKFGNIWMGGENILAKYADGAVKQTWKVNYGQGRKESIIYAIYPDRKGYVWIGINDAGPMYFNPSNGVFHRIDLGSFLDVHAFLEQEDGTMYIGTENSLYLYDNGKVRKEENINRIIHSAAIYALMNDSDNQLWIGTLSRGIFIFNSNRKLIAHLDVKNGLPSNNINQIYEDSKGVIWVATYNGLVAIRKNGKDMKFQLYNETNQLADCHIRAIAEDAMGNLWVTTYKGISCLRKGFTTFANYDHTDGLPEGGFVENSMVRISDGTMYVASPNGVGYFNPSMLKRKEIVSPLQLVCIESLNHQDKGQNISLDTEKIIVEYAENSLKFKFTVMDYEQIQRVEYAYMMDGMDKDWQFLGSENFVTFRNLSPGTYTFKLKARLKNGEWGKEILTKTIKVCPPLWLTWYFKLLYAGILLTVFYFLFKNYKKRLLLKNSLELQKKSLEIERRRHHDEQELNNERMKFYTNIAHELRTPLTLIVGPIEDLSEDNSLPSTVKKQVMSIRNNSIRLLNLINQIMEFRKAETQNRQLVVAKGDLGTIVKEVGLRFKELHRTPNVDFVIDIDKISTPIYFDREIVTTIISNFLSNAIKYTVKGHVKLGLDACQIEGEQYARIFVEDTGYGIDAAALPHVFDRYYQTKGKHQASGTGIGLALVKSLSELHQGILQVDSKLEVGSTFSFLIKTNEFYVHAQHKKESIKNEEMISETPTHLDADTCPTLLVVEDNQDIRDYIATSFCKDFKVLEAENGKLGFDLALQNIPDIIISDIMMPEMDGIELCRAIKNDIRTSHIPVILLTAKDSLQDKEGGYEMGADSYITKPFTAKLLRLRVKNLLEGRKRQAQIIMQSMPTKGNTDVNEQENRENILTEKEPQLNKLDRIFLEKLNHLIEENMVTQKIDMAFISDKMNMSHSTFYRKLKMLTGTTAVDYVRKFKLKKSLELIESEEFNITEIAYKTGFNSPAHFREAFKEEYGVPPSQYARSKTVS